MKYSIIWQVGLTEFWCILKLLNFTFILYGDICSTFDDKRWTNVTVYIYKYGVFMKGLFQFSVLSRPFLLSLECLPLQQRNYWQHLKVPYGPCRNCVTIFIWIFKEAGCVAQSELSQEYKLVKICNIYWEQFKVSQLTALLNTLASGLEQTKYSRQDLKAI